MVNETARIFANDEVGPNLYCMKLISPRIATAIQPGQFVHMKIPGMEAHVLRRPFSVYVCYPADGVLEILYQVVGFGTNHMTTLTPDNPQLCQVELIGPLGTSWNPGHAVHALLVGGGVGAAPLFMLAEFLVHSGIPTDVILGAQTKAGLVCRDRYKRLLSTGVAAERDRLLCVTDDGSFGRAAFCTLPAQEALDGASASGNPYDYVAVCGPEPLMKSVAGMAAKAQVRCEVSMERRMACGVGACLSCVVDTVDGRKRACVDGAVFDAQKVMW